MLRIDLLPLLCYNTPKVGDYIKRICLLILSVVLILSFSACGTNQENNSENDLPINNSQTDIDTSKYIKILIS